MDFLNKAFAQVSELFRSLTPGARITSGLLLAVLVVSLVYLVTSHGRGPDTYLLGGHPFPPGNMAAVQAALAKAGLGDYTVEGNLIRIPYRKQADYVAALADANLLPADSSDYLLKVVQEASPFASGSQRDQLLAIAREEMMANTIRKMSGIESATVMIDTRRKTGFRNEEIITASVQVKPAGTQALDDLRVHAIRNYVASSVAGLSPNKVTVVDANTGMAWTGTSADGTGGALDNEYFTLMRMYEQRYEQELLNLLSYVHGVTVGVNVELDTRRKSTKQDFEIDPKVVSLARREDSTSSTTESNNAAGRVGVVAQQSANRSAQLSAGDRVSQSQEETSSTEESNTASHTTEMTESVGLTPQKVTVAIGVPSSYFERIWHQRNPAAAGEELKTPGPQQLADIEQQEMAKIRETVFQRIPHTAGVDAASVVTVAAFTPLPSAEIPLPTISEQVVAWLTMNWATFGLIALAGFSLLMLRSMIRSGASAEVPMPSDVLLMSTPPSAGAGGGEESGEARLKRKFRGGPSVRDELVELVREDPDTAASILRGWIRSAG